ncbi:myo-inositol-1-monophosphatase [Rouxiella sp. S1S-2]|uniref:inositol monophosphatase family protein n=1 Tax=Rouxiella sp. S1S-2 TaxID=2653856 RepID=UPI0012644ED0|nr:inositol monophosphatase family protein [Rouxiella sp. S1S-2]KAB7898624.1 myo-inositol-1-monophosphatase [Rouxiella sp. S1S-2]
MMKTEISDRLRIASQIAAEAAELAMSFFARRSEIDVSSKRTQDFVSEADVAVETFIRQRLQQHFPNDPIIGEEMGGQLSDGACWVIDPIDGTSNFLRGSPLWGVSLGLVEHHRPVIGVVVLPVLNELFAAESGRGIFLNGMPFSRDNRFADVQVLSLGDSADDQLGEASAFYRGLREADWSVHCYRCTTVGMVFAAKGLIDGHLQRRTTLWDIAGGAVLCQEAGLETVVNFGSEGIRHLSVAVGTPHLMATVRPLWPDLSPR